MNAEEELGEELTPEQRIRRRRRLVGVLVVIAAVVLAIFVPPLVSLGRYRRSITASIAAALGRPVAVGGISLQLLPIPGITLSDFTVEEDPAFGAEPALHANSVVVSLRLSSLWRRRLEISRIRLDQASLNLVRNAAGQWSIEPILLRASQIPNAPTAQRHAGPTPRFPYIEATNSRIDFKVGAEKKPFSLMNAEFAMWQAGGGEWRIRLEAQPTRTDLPLQLLDVGKLNVDGSLRRGASLKMLPLDLNVAWRGAQLGQVSELLRGEDTGWRGSLDATGRISGTLADLQLRSTVQVGNLRRQEFQPLSAMNVAATCSAEYLHEQRTLDQITCFVPVSPGHLLLTGNLHASAAADADLQLEINHVPAEFPVALLGLMRSSLQSATAAGDINGSFRLVEGSERMLTGDATARGVSITNGGGSWALPDLHFVAAASVPQEGTHGGRRSRVAAEQHGAGSVPQAHGILLQPVAIPFGERAPLVADGALNRGGFTLHLAGPASMQRLTVPGAMLGLLRPVLAQAGQKGRADLNLTTRGAWLPPLAEPAVGLSTAGTIHFADLQLKPKFLPAPVAVDSADIVLGPQGITWRNAAIHFQGMALRGSLEYPEVCDSGVSCPAVFTLQAPALSGSAIEAALQGQRQGFFDRMFANALGGAAPSPWPALEGTVQAKTFNLDRLPLTQMTATIAVDRTGLTLQSLDASALGGTVHASGGMKLAGGVPDWTLDVRCTGIRPSDAGQIFREHWGTGRFDGETRLTLTGRSTAELEASAAGDFQFTWQNGGLAGAAGAGPLGHFALWSGSGSVASGAVTLSSGGLSRGGRVTPVRGSIGFDRGVNLTIRARSGPVHVRGTLAHPVSGR